eukprot:TRINITY_DN45878_c0_g1_i1.p1 TRINITY_DN45878_c0_g1~~TRINITY_DN45878_c0_g1_i1.p1  ORF type:complete len:107 (-),score=1.60 TRINITY_DN45878_c0_g1_i1:114-434(-)
MVSTKPVTPPRQGGGGGTANATLAESFPGDRGYHVPQPTPHASALQDGKLGQNPISGMSGMGVCVGRARGSKNRIHFPVKGQRPTQQDWDPPHHHHFFLATTGARG